MTKPPCSIEECDRPAHCRGWCKLHYTRWYNHGDPLTLLKGGRPQNRADGECVIKGCEKPGPFTKGMCGMHYMRQYKYGDPGIVMPKGPGRPQLVRQCRIDGCENPRPYTQGLCRPHYGMLLRHGDPLWEEPPRATCSVEGCERLWHVKGLCVMHYSRLREHGDVGGAAPLKAADGAGHVDSVYGYHSVKVNGKRVKSHRIVMEQILGRALLPNETVHHINGVRTDNRPENLELWTGMHGNGQRVEDLVAFVVANYRNEVLEALKT
jgi:hypothetical protein